MHVHVHVHTHAYVHVEGHVDTHREPVVHTYMSGPGWVGRGVGGAAPGTESFTASKYYFTCTCTCTCHVHVCDVYRKVCEDESVMAA